MRTRLTVLILCAFVILSIVNCSEDSDPAGNPGLPPREDFAGIDYYYPDSGSTGQSRTPALFFYGADGLQGWDMDYYVLIEGTLGEDAVSDTITAGSTDMFRYDCPVTLDAGTEYTWSVTVHDENGYDYSRGEWAFTTGDGFNNPPWYPFDPVPYHMADSISSDDFMLYWDCFDPDGDALTYDVWIKRNGSMMGWIRYGEKISGTDFDPGTFYPGATFNWQIVAFDEPGDSTVGDRWIFVTEE